MHRKVNFSALMSSVNNKGTKLGIPLAVPLMVAFSLRKMIFAI